MNKHLMRARAGLLVMVCSLPVISFAAVNVTTSETEIQQTSEHLSLKQALQLTLQQNPQLKAYPYYVRQLDGEVTQAKLRPVPRA
jgi:cobalt-zinc-cadmium efflux system outer membrane protein